MQLWCIEWRKSVVCSNTISSVFVRHLCLLGVLFLTGCSGLWMGEWTVVQIPVPQVPPRELQPSGYIQEPAINESSGLAQSDQYPGVFWTMNDSGDQARLFAIREDGSLVRPEDEKPYHGIRVKGAKNIDWEDIAKGPNGTLLIADVGNNANKRRDLVVYVVPEPDPTKDREVSVIQEIPVFYPEQKDFPPRNNNFDCEGVFYFGNDLYFVTKHRADRLCALYRLPYPTANSLPKDSQGYPLQLLDFYNLRGMVTAADSYQSRKVAVLTYGSVWVFDSAGPDSFNYQEPLSNCVYWQPIRAKQSESIAFIDADTLLIGNEQRDLYVLPVNEMVRLNTTERATELNSRELGHL